MDDNVMAPDGLGSRSLLDDYAQHVVNPSAMGTGQETLESPDPSRPGGPDVTTMILPSVDGDPGSNWPQATADMLTAAGVIYPSETLSDPRLDIQGRHVRGGGLTPCLTPPK
jgi:hypothetical protein